MNLRGQISAFIAVVALLTAVATAATADLTLASPAPGVLAKVPVVTYMSPKEGDVLQGPPFVLQMCFEQPVNIRDLDKGGDFRFSLLKEDGFGLGMRLVFQIDGYGLAIYPGQAAGQINGEWTLSWRLTDATTLEPAEGTLKFTVDPVAGQPVPTSTPPACLAGGSPGPTNTTAPVQTTSPTPGPLQTASAGSTGQGPTASGGVGGGAPEQSGTPTQSATTTPAATGGGDEGSGPDLLLLALLAAGAAGGAGLLALIVYLIRKRFSDSPRPPAGGPEHH